MISEIKEALVVDNPILEAFNIFSMETQSEEYRREQMHNLCNHYGDQINDVYQGDSTSAEAIISTLEQKVEFQDFICTFDEVVKELNNQAKKQPQQKVLKGEIKQKDVPAYLNTIKPTLSDVYSKMCYERSVHNFPNNMKLLKIALLITPSASGVERGFSVMNLLVSPLLKSLSKNNIDRPKRICLDGPKFLSEKQLEQIIDIHKDNAPRRISVMFFVVIFYRCFSEPCSLTYLEIFIDISIIHIDYFGLKYMQSRIYHFFGRAGSMFSLFYLVCLV